MKIYNRFTKELIIEVSRNRQGFYDLEGTYLAGANLARANLARADLRGTDLEEAYLAGADLAGAYLAGANLTGADLAGVKNLIFREFPSISFLASCFLGIQSKDLQVELMRRDVQSHPNPKLFDEWANNNGPCPYNNVMRFWQFEAKKEYWSPGPPTMNDVDLIKALCKEQGWEIDDK